MTLTAVLLFTAPKYEEFVLRDLKLIEKILETAIEHAHLTEPGFSANIHASGFSYERISTGKSKVFSKETIPGTTQRKLIGSRARTRTHHEDIFFIVRMLAPYSRFWNGIRAMQASIEVDVEKFPRFKDFSFFFETKDLGYVTHARDYNKDRKVS